MAYIDVDCVVSHLYLKVLVVDAVHVMVAVEVLLEQTCLFHWHINLVLVSYMYISYIIMFISFFLFYFIVFIS